MERLKLKHPTVLKHYKKIVADMGWPDLRFHDLRHAYAVLSLQAGDDIKTVQENLGHHSAAFTMYTYAHVTDAMRKESSERMDNLINNI
ncbi:tyrosine-type recombinase/integrase [Eubacteriaceae bacterium ES2]|nr:tyrosine-type recombinase/integrase [Eubacteriaceae bacterium ES2]